MNTDANGFGNLGFHPLIRDWFEGRFGAPTEPQARGWPAIRRGRPTLIAAPTGSGKTLAAFLVCLDDLFHQADETGGLPSGIQVVYVSPLKALSNDIQRNLQSPLAEIAELAEARGVPMPQIRTAVRTGDTPASQRQAMLRRPPHILVTTPESLYLMLTSEKTRDTLQSVHTVIVDEIHALARDKRGSHLALTLERLEHFSDRTPVRIGLSATQRPIEQIGQFLVGSGEDREPCEIIDGGHVRQLDLAVEVPPSELSAVCSNEQWSEVYSRLIELIEQHRSTLIFVNTRRLAERVAHHLTEQLGDNAVASHHGSLSRALRHSAEQRLKNGELKAIVATASLEMGIDIGFIDLVCQIGSPRSIATFLQRVGRSGHCLGATPRGRIFPLTRDELLESMALHRAVAKGELDRIEMPVKPLDILAQQVIASVAADDWDEDALFDLCRRAWPYRDLARDEFERVVRLVSEGMVSGSRRGAYVHRDRIERKLRARRAARLAAITSGGAIPETAEFRVVTEDEGTFVGTVDEDFAIDSSAGDVFLLGTTSWRISHVRGGQVVVRDAQGAPPTVPFWFGEAPGRTIELSQEVSQLRGEIAGRLAPPQMPAGEGGAGEGGAGETAAEGSPSDDVIDDLVATCGVDAWAAEQAVRYVDAQQKAVGVVPTKDRILFERFFDESGGMQLVIHSPLGARINRAWGLALRKRFCRSFDFELQAAADDNGIVLSLSPQHSFPVENLFTMLGPHNARYLLEQAVLAVPMFQVRWRWNVTRALAVLRMNKGKKVPPHLQRFRAEDLLAGAFPETVGCLENHHGDVEVPDHPMVQQTMHDCLHEAMDVERWIGVLQEVHDRQIELIGCETREPSPFSHELVNANPYAFLDEAGLEERRTRAVTTRRSLLGEDVGDLIRLDPEIVEQVTRDAWPTVRDVEELHDALCDLVLVREDEAEEWGEWMRQLVRKRRATRVTLDGSKSKRAVRYWVAAERVPLVELVYPEARCEPRLELCESLRAEKPDEKSKGWVELVRGRMRHSGPTTAADLGQRLQLETSHVQASLEALEGEGVVMRGRFDSTATKKGTREQWCDRRLLARIHKGTLEGLRRRIQPVDPKDYLRFLAEYHHLSQPRAGGPNAVREVIQQLQGFELAAAAWEKSILAYRLRNYDPQWLDVLLMSGEVMWARLRPPARPGANGRGGESKPNGRSVRSAMSPMTRTAPINLFFRENLGWLVPPDRSEREAELRGPAATVVEALQTRGALFSAEVKAVTGLLPTELDEALRELAALGKLTSDSYASVRTVVGSRNRTMVARSNSGAVASGRWSLFPGLYEAAEPDDTYRKWCDLLLRRYGVVFRDLLARETAAPPWYRLRPILRRMELRGEVRGGRFIQGVAGEQFASEETVTRLRTLRDSEPEQDWVLISAADPLNLIGIITDEERIPATHKNFFILQNGRCVAVRQAGSIEFRVEGIDDETRNHMRQALIHARKVSPQDAATDRHASRKPFDPAAAASVAAPPRRF